MTDLLGVLVSVPSGIELGNSPPLYFDRARDIMGGLVSDPSGMRRSRTPINTFFSEFECNIL